MVKKKRKLNNVNDINTQPVKKKVQGSKCNYRKSTVCTFSSTNSPRQKRPHNDTVYRSQDKEKTPYNLSLKLLFHLTLCQWGETRLLNVVNKYTRGVLQYTSCQQDTHGWALDLQRWKRLNSWTEPTIAIQYSQKEHPPRSKRKLRLNTRTWLSFI